MPSITGDGAVPGRNGGGKGGDVASECERRGACHVLPHGACLPAHDGAQQAQAGGGHRAVDLAILHHSNEIVLLEHVNRIYLFGMT